MSDAILARGGWMRMVPPSVRGRGEAMHAARVGNAFGMMDGEGARRDQPMGGGHHRWMDEENGCEV